MLLRFQQQIRRSRQLHETSVVHRLGSRPCHKLACRFSQTGVFNVHKTPLYKRKSQPGAANQASQAVVYKINELPSVSPTMTDATPDLSFDAGLVAGDRVHRELTIT